MQIKSYVYGLFHTFPCEAVILLSNTVQCQIYKYNSYIMRCIHLYARSETSSSSIKIFKVTRGFTARSLKLNFAADMIFKGTRMKLILFYSRFAMQVLQTNSSSNIRINYTLHVFFFQRFGGLNSLQQIQSYGITQ